MAVIRRPLATSDEVAAYLGVSKRTLDDWASDGRGPDFIKVGQQRRYHWDDIDAYVERHRRSGGGEAA